ncbi:fluoride efflux transporter CrcB [Exilibacterium tricleocarpae]|uniref:Fluoride-specific ion channel FluC n=1 Tax=Exilibacterium tricleocarpae TaxID=2591008 RepID=A0A545T8M1_9GAMM|nr:fluoride efflux transporter CrcB [Exilibacterium tricleocarpae]TQV73551.1 fluoride efflux transporter CrcB [Exilibacterium tricleocarpae]
MHWLAVALGGALGALGRYAVTSYAYPIMENRFPLGTLIVNVLGSFLIGVCYVVIIEKGLVSPEWRHLLMAGFLGAFTTFSTFSLDALNLWQNGHALTALTYIAASVITCLAAVALAVHVSLRIF